MTDSDQDQAPKITVYDDPVIVDGDFNVDGSDADQPPTITVYNKSVIVKGNFNVGGSDDAGDNWPT